MEVGFEGCLDMLMLCACCLLLCTLKRTLPVPDILSISIQIPYYTNVRKLCRYYNMFEFISFVMYNVESILLSSYVVWRNDLLIHTMLLDGFILLESFVTPAGISMGIKLRTEFFPILWVIRLHWYRKFVKCIAIIIPTCHSQYRRSAWNPLFSTMGQIDQVDRRFNLDPTTPNCIYLGTLN